MKSKKEKRVELESMNDLKPEMFCPDCGKELKYPEYECECCQHQLVFYIKNN